MNISRFWNWFCRLIYINMSFGFSPRPFTESNNFFLQCMTSATHFLNHFHRNKYDLAIYCLPFYITLQRRLESWRKIIRIRSTTDRQKDCGNLGGRIPLHSGLTLFHCDPPPPPPPPPPPRGIWQLISLRPPPPLRYMVTILNCNLQIHVADLYH